MDEAKSKKAGSKKTTLPNMVVVKSSNISEIGYDGKTETLYVRFVSGSMYAYSGVPEKRAMGLFNADSKGEYFADNIKNDYQYTKA